MEGHEKPAKFGCGSPLPVRSVSFQRPGVTTPINLTFVRREVHVPAVPYFALIEGIGYIPLQTFNENASEEVMSAAIKLTAQGAKGLVLGCKIEVHKSG